MKGLEPGEYKLYAWEDIEPGAYMDGAIRHNPQILQNQFRTSEVTAEKPGVEIEGEAETKPTDAERQKLRVISSTS